MAAGGALGRCGLDIAKGGQNSSPILFLEKSGSRSARSEGLSSHLNWVNPNTWSKYPRNHVPSQGIHFARTAFVLKSPFSILSLEGST
jgi:hypothetical protein